MSVKKKQSKTHHVETRDQVLNRFMDKDKPKQGRPKKNPAIPSLLSEIKRKRGRPKKTLPTFPFLEHGKPVPPSSENKTEKKWIGFKTTIMDTPDLIILEGLTTATPTITVPPEIPRTLANGSPDPFPEVIVVSEGIDSVAIIHWKTTGKSLGLRSMITAGFLIRKDQDTLTLAQTIQRGRYNKKEVFTIPMSLVTKIEKLTEPNLIKLS